MEAYPVNMAVEPEVSAYLDSTSNTITYLVKDPHSQHCAIIDSVADFDYAAGRLVFDSADQLIDTIETRQLILDWIIETHIHADHLSAAPYIQQKLGGKIGIGEHIKTVQENFGKIFNEGTEFQRDGSQFDRLFKERDRYRVGNMDCFTLHTPGHTPACMVHVIGNATFTGDTLFMPDSGSGRTDFPGGDAAALYDSIQKVLRLPDDMRLFICHDYGPNGRPIRWETTIAEQKANNIHFGGDTTREDFIAFRNQKDAQLGLPKLIIPSIQVNMRAGNIPADKNGNAMLKVPLNGF